jgi:tetratricopeptide (TPR) repeat protein
LGVRFTIAVTGCALSWWLPARWIEGRTFPEVQTLSERLWQFAPFFLGSAICLVFLFWTLKLLREVSGRSGKWGSVVITSLLLFFSVFILNALLTDWSGPQRSGLLRWLFWIVSAALFLLVALAIFWLQLWVVGLAMQGDYDRALRISRTLSWLSSFGPSFQGRILFQAGRYSEAQACLKPIAFDETGQPRLTSNDFYIYTQALSNGGAEAEAQPLFEAAIQAPQTTPRIHVGLAGCLLDQKRDADRALELMEQVLSAWRQPGQSSSAWAHRTAQYARALASCGRRAEAEAKLQEAMAGAEKFGSRDRAWLHFYAGKTYLALGDLKKARTEYQEANKLQPYGNIALHVKRRLSEIASSN